MSHVVEGVTLCRDLTNMPSNDMGPAELEAAARTLAKKHSAKIQVTSGDALAKNFPLVHAVGAGSARAPRLIDIKSRWSEKAFVSIPAGSISSPIPECST